MKISMTNLGEPLRTKNKHEQFYKCPYHDDKTGHLGVNTKLGIYHCFKCNISGRVKDLEIPVSNFDEFVENKLRPDQGRTIASSRASRLVELPYGCKLVSVQSGLPYRYLSYREITDREMNLYRLHYCSEGPFGGRIIIPIYEEEKLVYFVGRTYLGGTPKYLNAPVSKEEILFKTFEGNQETVFVTEGIFDALRVGKAFPAVSLLGKVATKAQIKKLAELADEIIIMLDNDAYVNAFNLKQKLEVYHSNCKMVMLEDKDPGSIEVEQIRRIYEDLHKS
jgi:hypothetical protein